MLASISPLGERARGNRWGLTATAYTAASAAAAASLAGVLGLGGEFASRAVRAPAGSLAAVVAFAVLLDAARRVPTAHRQVDEQWLGRYRGWVYGAGFGAQLGLGVTTVVTTATVYAWLFGCVLLRSPAGAAAAGLAFGLSRAAPLALVAAADSPDAVRRAVRRLSLAQPKAHVGALGATSVVAVLALVGR